MESRQLPVARYKPHTQINVMKASPIHKVGLAQLTCSEKRVICRSRVGRSRIRNGVPRRTRARSFSRAIAIRITPRIMFQPQSERVVSGVNCQGKFAISNVGKMNALSAPKATRLPPIQNRERIQAGRGESEFEFGWAARRCCQI